MKTVYISAPLGGDVKANLARVKKAVKIIKKEMEEMWFPHTPVLFVPHFATLGYTWDEEKGETDRETGMRLCLHMVRVCDSMIMIGENITSGMREEMEIAHHYNKKITVRSDL